MAAAVKLVVLAQLGGHPLLQPQGALDGAHYVELAQRLATGGSWLLGDAHAVSPLYVYFLGAIFAAGGDLATARLVQVLLGTAAVGILFLTARQWYGDRAALLAGGFAAATGVFTFYEVTILQAALDPFLVAGALHLVSRTAAGQGPAHAALAGLATGLLVLNRPNALLYAILVAAWLAWGARPGRAPGEPGPHALVPARSGRRHGLATAAVFAVALALPLIANGIRNLAASGHFVPVASHGGLNFYIGNHAGADGTYQLVPGITPSIVGQVRDAAREAEAEAQRPLTPGEVSAYYHRRAWAWMAAEPGDAARLLLRKLVLVLHRANVPLNYSYEFYRVDEPGLLRWLPVGAWILVPLGLAGLLLPSLRVRHDGFPVWATFVPIYAVSVAAFFVSSRYRMPLLVPLCAASGATLAWTLDRLRAREWRRLAAPAALAAAAAVISTWPLSVDEGLGGERTRKAVWLVEQGRLEEAERYVATVAPTHTHPGVLHFRVAETLATANRFDAAIHHYQRALTLDGARPAIVLPLGQALVVAGRAQEAVPHLRAVLDAGHRRDVAATWLVRALALAGRRSESLALLEALDDDLAGPSGGTAAADLGTLALQLDAPDRALRWWQLAARQAPADADAHESLGATLLLLNREAEAVAPLEAACRLDASSAGARMNLALAFARLGRLEEALARAREAERLAPGEPRISSLVRTLTRGVAR